MECLQYTESIKELARKNIESFKPCYKWNAFNTDYIHSDNWSFDGFKPCYKWNAFNTSVFVSFKGLKDMSFKPCYKWNAFNTEWRKKKERGAFTF